MTERVTDFRLQDIIAGHDSVGTSLLVLDLRDCRAERDALRGVIARLNVQIDSMQGALVEIAAGRRALVEDASALGAAREAAEAEREACAKVAEAWGLPPAALPRAAATAAGIAATIRERKGDTHGA